MTQTISHPAKAGDPVTTATKLRRPRVYVARPMITYSTEYGAQGLVSVATALPGCEIIDPAGRYTSSAGWRRAWPRMLGTLDAVVVLRSPDETVGTGVLHEMIDAVHAGVPVAVLGDWGWLHECRGIVLVGPDTRTPLRAAWVLVGALAPNFLAAVRLQANPQHHEREARP